MTAPSLMMVPAPLAGGQPCCCTRSTALHCPACHAGSHNLLYLYLVVDTSGAVRCYDDQREAQQFARAAGAAVGALPLLADYRTPAVHPDHPAVGRVPLVAVPEQPDPVAEQLADYGTSNGWGIEHPTPPQQPDPPDPPSVSRLVRPFVESWPDPGPNDEHNDQSADASADDGPGGYTVGDPGRVGDAGQDYHREVS